MWTCGKRFHIKWNLKFKSKTIKHNPACASNSFQCGISIKPLCVDVSRWCIGMNCEPLMMCSYIMASALHVYAAHESLNTCLQEMHWVNLSRLNTYNFTRQLAAHWPHRWFPPRGWRSHTQKMLKILPLRICSTSHLAPRSHTCASSSNPANRQRRRSILEEK